MRHPRATPASFLTSAGLVAAAGLLLFTTPPCAAAPATTTPLGSFGKVLQRHQITLGPAQHVVIGETFHGPGSELEFGLVEGRWHDRLYYRSNRRILREWEIPGPGLPDSALSYGRSFAALFSEHDTLFVELFQPGDPSWATGERAIRVESLFQKWIRGSFERRDRAEAEALGIPEERFKGPPPELVCPLGRG